MSFSAPKLRTDLVISRQETREGIFFVVKEPLTGRFFRLRETEHFITQQLDGSTTLDRVRQKVEQQFGSALAPETLNRFSENLQRLGLLETEGTKRSDKAGHGRVRGSLFYLRFPGFDPDRLLNRLMPMARFFFTPAFLVLSAFAVLCALGVIFSNWSEITRDFRSLWHFNALLLAWLTVLGVTALHEFAHGLTCKHFGGAVHEMGFMLIYFQPAFYCNISDAWLFPEKYKRLWVTFAGAYFEIFLWSLATLVWRAVEPGTWMSFLALVVMATSAIKTLLNLNPLIKLDGYYLLGDYLEVPNLRQKSIRYLGAGIKWLVGGTVSAVGAASRRERRIYLVYGLLAGVYSYWLLSSVALRFGDYLVTRYRGVGFILFGGFLVVFLRNPLRRLFAKAGAPFNGIQARFGSVRRPIKILAMAAILLGVLFLGRMQLKASGEFRALPLHNADVRAEVEGIVEQIYVDEGDVVRKGDLIAQLFDRDLRAELSRTDAELEEKQAKLKMLRAGTRPEEIELACRELDTARTRMEQSQKHYDEARQMHAERLSKAQSAVQKAQAQLAYTAKNLERFKGLVTRGLISRKEFEESEEQMAVRQRELEGVQAEFRGVVSDDLAEFRKELAVAGKAVEEATAKLELLRAGSRHEEITAAEAEVARLTAQKHYLEELLRLLKMVSPTSGVITTPSLELKEKLGQYVKKGDLIAKVHELETVMAQVAISEKEIAEVQLGQKVVVKARAYPQQRFEGKVVSIASTATGKDKGKGENAAISWNEERVVLVTTELDNRSLLLKPEMTGHAKIYAGERPIIEILTRGLARYLRVEFWSLW